MHRAAVAADPDKGKHFVTMKARPVLDTEEVRQNLAEPNPAAPPGPSLRWPSQTLPPRLVLLCLGRAKPCRPAWPFFDLAEPNPAAPPGPSLTWQSQSLSPRLALL
eukprot:7386472-Prymnesium_polylepis.2